MGVATGCGCKEVHVYRFTHTTYPYSSCICSFLQQYPYFLFIKKKFFVLVQYFFVITFYVLNNFFAQYKHTYGQLRLSHGSHMKAAHTVLYMKKHTHKRTLHILHWTSAVWAWCRSRSRGRTLFRDASLAGRLRTVPASFKGQRSRTRRWIQCMPRRVRIRVPRLPRARYRVMAS